MPDHPVIVFAFSPIRSDAFKDFFPVLLEDVVQGRKESGNVSFDIYQREEGGSDLFLFERWKNRAAFEEHLKAPYVQAVLDTRPDALRKGEEPVATFLTELSPPAPHKHVNSPAATRNVVTALHIKPEARGDFLAALLGVVGPTRAASGNLAFDVYQDVEDQNALVIVERWESAATYDAHMARPSYQAFNAIPETSLVTPLNGGRYLLRDVAQ